MSAPNISRDAALRIALAARILPDISVAQLVGVLAENIEGEISVETLSKVTVTDLKKGFSGGDDHEELEDADIDIGLPELKEAVRMLWGEIDLENLPQVTPLESVPPRSVRVAIASNSDENLDGHFGSCLRFLIYQITDSTQQLIDIRSTADEVDADDKNAYRAGLIDDCQVLYVVSVGGPAAAKIIKAGVYPIKKTQGGTAQQILAELQNVMITSPPPWLAKHLGDQPDQRIRFERDEDAEELFS